MKTRAQEIAERIAELDALIANAPGWGAVLTAYDEERRGLQRELAVLEGQRELPL